MCKIYVRHFAFFCLALFVFGVFNSLAGTLSPVLTMTTRDGTARTYRVYTPDGYNSAQSVPLVFSLHGGFGNAVMSSTCPTPGVQCHPSVRWQDLADAHNFLVVYPNSTVGASSGQHWNDCRADAAGGVGAAKDVQFISELIDRIKNDFPKTDLERVYATGTSNGSMMSFRLAQELSDRIAAIGANIGSRPVDPNNECRPPLNPIAVFQHNGTQDPLNLYAGGGMGEGGGVFPAETTRDFWIKFNGSGVLSAPAPIGNQAYNADGGFYTILGNPLTFNSPDYNGTIVNSTATVVVSNGGQEAVASYFYRTENGGHKSATTIPKYMQSPQQTDRIAGAENHDFNLLDEMWDKLKNFTVGGTRWARIDFGAAAGGNSFVKNPSGDFVNTLTPGATWTISGDAAGWNSQTDALHFLYRPLRGDGSLTAKFSGFNNTTADSEFALMLRTSLDANAIFYSISVQNYRLRVVRRGKGGQTSREISSIPIAAAPAWLRMTRTGRLVKISYSTDGSNFAELAALYPRISQPLPPTTFIGFAFAGGGAATFSDVQAVGNNP